MTQGARHGEDRRLGRRAAARAGFDVDIGIDWTREQLAERIGDYDGILIRSATKIDAELIEQADRLRAIGRAGVGVDNVDVPAATKRGIVVANAPQSNVVTAAEHTMALLLALARNIPQAHASLIDGAMGPLEVLAASSCYEKTLGMLGFGRIGQLVAQRAHGLRHAACSRSTRSSAPSATASSASRRRETPEDVYAAADFITIHLPKTPETEGWLNAEAFAKMRDGVRVLNVARGGLIVDAELKAALDSGKVARRRARRLPQRADDRAPAVRATRTSSSRRTSAPRPPRRPTAPATRPPSRSSPR